MQHVCTFFAMALHRFYKLNVSTYSFNLTFKVDGRRRMLNAKVHNKYNNISTSSGWPESTLNN